MKFILNTVLVTGSILLLSSYNIEPKENQSINYLKSETMLMKQNKETIRKLYEDCLNKRNYELLKELVSEDYSGPRGEKGVAGLEQSVKPIIVAFPDIQWKIEDLLEDGDKVVVRWSWQGTHSFVYQGIQASNKIVKNEAIAIYHLKDTKIIGAVMQTDRLGFLIQLGVISPDVVPGGQSKK